MITNRLGLPRAFVRRIEEHIHDRDPDDAYTISELNLPPRLLALQRLHGDAIVQDASEFTWMLFGTVAHDILASDPEDDQLVEVRLRTTIDGVQISGKPDRLTADGVLEDHKFTSNWAFKEGIKPDWLAQVNCYAYLARLNGYRVERGRITAYLREWNPSTAAGQRGTGRAYPPDPVLQMPIDLLWDDEQCHVYLRSRIALHEAIDLGPWTVMADLPRCTPEERWERPTRWAVMKTPAAKRASRVLDTEAAALEYQRLNGGSIQLRPGASPRCLYYCPVRSVCEQGWEYRFDAGEEE